MNLCVNTSCKCKYKYNYLLGIFLTCSFILNLSVLNIVIILLGDLDYSSTCFDLVKSFVLIIYETTIYIVLHSSLVILKKLPDLVILTQILTT